MYLRILLYYVLYLNKKKDDILMQHCTFPNSRQIYLILMLPNIYYATPQVRAAFIRPPGEQEGYLDIFCICKAISSSVKMWKHGQSICENPKKCLQANVVYHLLVTIICFYLDLCREGTHRTICLITTTCHQVHLCTLINPTILKVHRTSILQTYPPVDL